MVTPGACQEVVFDIMLKNCSWLYLGDLVLLGTKLELLVHKILYKKKHLNFSTLKYLSCPNPETFYLSQINEDIYICVSYINSIYSNRILSIQSYNSTLTTNVNESMSMSLVSQSLIIHWKTH